MDASNSSEKSAMLTRTPNELEQFLSDILLKDSHYYGIAFVEEEQVKEWVGTEPVNKTDIDGEFEEWSSLWRLMKQSIPIQNEQMNHPLFFRCRVRFAQKDLYLLSQSLKENQHLVLLAQPSANIERAVFWMKTSLKKLDHQYLLASQP